MHTNTDHFSRCIKTLESSLKYLEIAPKDSIEYEVFRNAVVKGFELTLETAGKLLRKCLKIYIANPHSVDELTFKDVLRTAGKHGILNSEAIERWMAYRNNRNNTAHDYGVIFAEKTLKLLSPFVKDAKALEKSLKERFK